MSTVRLRRLQADYQKLQSYVNRHPRVRLVQAEGNPPERYQFQYQIRSLQQKDDQLVEAVNHLVEVVLPLNYPRLPPQCRMLTPIFHPNIAPHAICIGDHWSAGESLASIVARIGELISYQSYNTKSPLNGEAARWTDENISRLPLDSVSLLVEESNTPAAAPTHAPARAPVPPPVPAQQPRPVPAPVPAVANPLQVTCPGCSAQLRVRPEHAGLSLGCPRCKTILTVPRGAVRT